MAELGHRRAMWEELRRAGGPSRVRPELLHRLGIYGGAQGIWTDKDRTAPLTGGRSGVAVLTGGRSGVAVLTGGRSGVAVAVLHTGPSYPDDLGDDGGGYHYPVTRRSPARDAGEGGAGEAAGELGPPLFLVSPPTPSRSPARDAGEVEAVKAAGKLGLPIFVITYPTPSSSRRDVRLGWVTGHDDQAGQFLILFGDEPPQPVPDEDEASPFELVGSSRA